MTAARCPRCGRTAEIPEDGEICQPCRDYRRPKLIPAAASLDMVGYKPRRKRGKRR